MDLAMLEAALRANNAVVQGIGAADWHRPTPCTEWDVAALVAHVTDTNRNFIAALRHEPPGASGDAATDPAAAYAVSVEESLAAWRQPGALDGSVTLPFGEVPAGVALGIQFGDNLIHQWDLASALGRPVALDPAAAQAMLAFSRSVLTDEMRQPGGFFGPPVAVPEDAPMQDQVIAYLGRDPAKWRVASPA